MHVRKSQRRTYHYLSSLEIALDIYLFVYFFCMCLNAFRTKTTATLHVGFQLESVRIANIV